MPRTGRGHLMPARSPRHGAVYVQSLAEDLLAQGFSEAEVFRDFPFGPEILGERNPVAEFSDIAAFFEHAAELTDDDTLGFRRGEVREMRRIGLLCYVGISSPTVMDFIKNIARYRRVFTDALEIDVQHLEDRGELRWSFAVPSTVGRRQYVEFGASGIVAAIRQATQTRIEPLNARFRHARNTDVAMVESFLGCPVQFGTEVNAFQFAAADLSLPLSTSDDHLFDMLQGYAEDALQRSAPATSSLVVRVEREIADRLASGEAVQDIVSRAMGMSARTLSRRLAEEDTTFFSILDNLRHSLAITYLSNPDLRLREIAFLLGYSSLAAFHDAFRRWTGTSPGKFRDRET